MTTHMTTVAILASLFLATAAAADAPVSRHKPATPPSSETCFELSADGNAWSKTPEVLCVGAGSKHVVLSLLTGLPTGRATVATFHLDLTSRVKCAECNQDQFALANPSNSVFNALAIKFEGKRDLQAGTETGVVSIGSTSFHYRRTH